MPSTHPDGTERLDHWRSVLSRAFVPLEPSALSAPAVPAAGRCGEFGATQAVESIEEAGEGYDA